MMIENRIYKAWGFTKDEKLKRDMNLKIYDELKNKYKILVLFNERQNLNDYDTDDYDVIIEAKPGFCRSFHVVKNVVNLIDDEIALICDRGDLWAGYKKISDYDLYIY